MTAGRIYFYALGFGLMLGACSRTDRSPSADLLARDRRIAELEKQAQDLNTRREQEVSGLRQELARKDAEYAEHTTDLRQQLQLKDRRISDLDQKIRELTALSREISGPPPGPIFSSVSSPVQPGSVSALTRRQPEPDFFPLRVYDVSGQTVVVGTHTTYRTVDTEETYRDDFGNKKHFTASEAQVATQYVYQAAFSVENNSSLAREFTAQAGLIQRSFSVPAASTETNLTVEAARGSGLRVTVGGETRSFPVGAP